MPIIGVGDTGAGGAAALPTLEKFAKFSNDRAENRPKVGQNLRKQWIFYRAAPLNFISPYAYDAHFLKILNSKIHRSKKKLAKILIMLAGP